VGEKEFKTIDDVGHLGLGGRGVRRVGGANGDADIVVGVIEYYVVQDWVDAMAFEAFVD